MKRILIISLNALGDTYLSLSSIKPLTEYYKKVSFDIITLKDSKSLLQCFNFNKICLVDKDSYCWSFMVYYFLKTRKYDFVLSFFPGRLNTLLVNLSKSNNKYYYRNYKRNNYWYTNSQFVYLNRKQTKSAWHPEDNFLKRISLILDFIISERYNLKKPTLEMLESGNNYQGNYIAINFSSRDNNKKIGLELLVKMIKYFSFMFEYNILIFDYYDELISDKLLRIYAIKPENIIDVSKIIINSILFISVDSFLIHLADAYQVKSLGLFGPTNPVCVLSNNSFSIIKKETMADISLSDIIEKCKLI